MCPNREGPPVSVLPQNDHIESSLSRFSWRQTCMPQVCIESRANRSCEKGIRNSAVHPSESIAVFASHTGSQDGSAFGDACPASCFTPDGLTAKMVLPRGLWYGRSEGKQSELQ